MKPYASMGPTVTRIPPQATNQALNALTQKSSSRLNDQLASAANAAGKVASAVTSKLVTNTVNSMTQVCGGRLWGMMHICVLERGMRGCVVWETFHTALLSWAYFPSHVAFAPFWFLLVLVKQRLIQIPIITHGLIVNHATSSPSSPMA